MTTTDFHDLKSRLAISSPGKDTRIAEVDLGAFSVTRVTSMVGEVRHSLDGEHSIVLAPAYSTVTPAAVEGARLRDVTWEPNRIGYLPPKVRLDAAVIQPATATYVTLPSKFLRDASYETIDPNRVDYRWMTNVDDPVSVALISSMHRITENSDVREWPILTEHICSALSVNILRLLGAKPRRAATPYPDGLSQHRLRLVIDYVNDHIGRPISLSELAGITGLSTFHFSRSFKKAMNISPVRYVWQQRIELAKVMLRTTTESLASISYGCGFSSQAHFTTLFKSMTGRTPAAWRAALSALLVGKLWTGKIAPLALAASVAF
jgi:AraC family transcriptional regulator